MRFDAFVIDYAALNGRTPHMNLGPLRREPERELLCVIAHASELRRVFARNDVPGVSHYRETASLLFEFACAAETLRKTSSNSSRCFSADISKAVSRAAAPIRRSLSGSEKASTNP